MTILFSDINECLNEENTCDHQCNDTDGSFLCLCREGFKLSDDQYSCEGLFSLTETELAVIIMSRVCP